MGVAQGMALGEAIVGLPKIMDGHPFALVHHPQIGNPFLAPARMKPVKGIAGGLAPAKLTQAISLADVLTISRFFRNRSV